MPNVLLLGGGAREHSIGWSLVKNPSVRLFTLAHNHNPGLFRISTDYLKWRETDLDQVVEWAKEKEIDIAVVGLEDPLAIGVVDRLEDAGIPTIGPRQNPARLESSKFYTRELMRAHNIPGRIEFHYFTSAADAETFLLQTSKDYALKPDGLTAGQGVRIMGEHFASNVEAAQYARRVIEEQIGGVAGIVIEERLIGHEFTLQCFVDGSTVRPMPMVRDYKRAYDGDHGPNTGSMGSYSTANGTLPSVDQSLRTEALEILQRITDAVRSEGTPYKGVMYGQFMATSAGLRLIEINARFGDPEAINVLSVLETDLLSIFFAILRGTLDEQEIRFRSQATVCTYVTPQGYGEEPQVGTQLYLDEEKIASEGVLVFFAKVDEQDGRILTTKSRSIGFLGIADSVPAARAKVRAALGFVSGPFHVRRDIGSEADLFSAFESAQISAGKMIR